MTRRFFSYSLFFLALLLFLAGILIFSYGVLNSIPQYTTILASYTHADNQSANYLHYSEPVTKEIKLLPTNQKNEVKLLVVGDMMFEKPLDEIMVHQGADPFDYVRSYLKTFDVILGSIETNIAPWEVGTPQQKPYRFRAPVQALDRLKFAGFTMLSVANNHTMDYGPEAFLKQLELTQSKGMLTVGGGATIQEAFAPRYVEINSTKIAFIGLNAIESSFQDVQISRPGTAYFDPVLVSQSIAVAREEADVVIVYCHWGREHVPEPTDFQKQWAQYLIKSGADLVVGSHPHIRQRAEFIDGKPVIYSLGGFVYTGMGWSEEALYGSVLEITIRSKSIYTTSIRTVKMNYHGYPSLIDF